MEHAFLNKTFSSNNKYVTKDLYVKTYLLKEVVLNMEMSKIVKENLCYT